MDDFPRFHSVIFREKLGLLATTSSTISATGISGLLTTTGPTNDISAVHLIIPCPSFTCRSISSAKLSMLQAFMSFPWRSQEPLVCGDLKFKPWCVFNWNFHLGATPDFFSKRMNLIAGPMTTVIRRPQRKKLRVYRVAQHNLSYPKHPTPLTNENVFWILNSCKSSSGKFRCISTLGWIFIPLPIKGLAHVPPI